MRVCDVEREILKWIFCASCDELDSQEKKKGGAFFDLLSSGQYSVIALIIIYRGGEEEEEEEESLKSGVVVIRPFGLVYSKYKFAPVFNQEPRHKGKRANGVTAPVILHLALHLVEIVPAGLMINSFNYTNPTPQPLDQTGLIFLFRKAKRNP